MGNFWRCIHSNCCNIWPSAGEDVRSALDDILEGKELSKKAVPSTGCGIKWHPSWFYKFWHEVVTQAPWAEETVTFRSATHIDVEWRDDCIMSNCNTPITYTIDSSMVFKTHVQLIRVLLALFSGHLYLFCRGASWQLCSCNCRSRQICMSWRLEVETSLLVAVVWLSFENMLFSIHAADVRQQICLHDILHWVRQSPERVALAWYHLLCL